MARKGHTEEQILRALHQAEGGTRISDICREHGISEATYYIWKKRYAGLGLSGLRELRQLRVIGVCSTTGLVGGFIAPLERAVAAQSAFQPRQFVLHQPRVVLRQPRQFVLRHKRSIPRPRLQARTRPPGPTGVSARARPRRASLARPGAARPPTGRPDGRQFLRAFPRPPTIDAFPYDTSLRAGHPARM